MRRILLPLLFCLCVSLWAEGGQEQAFTLYYTSSLNGNLDGCECKGSPKAGLVKRAAFLRTRSRAESILVDAGDILDVTPDEELTRHILEIYRELGYDVIAIGDQEFSNGTEALAQQIGATPFLANNLTLKLGQPSGRLTPEPIVIRKGKLRVNVIALIDPDVFALYPKQLKAQLDIAPPAAVLASLLPGLKVASDPGSSELTILLYHGTVEAAAALAAQTPELDVVIVGHEQRLVHPQRAGSAILASPGEEGNRVGILTLRLRRGAVVGYSHEFRLLDYTRDLDDSSVRKRIEQYREALRSKVRG